MKNLLYSLLCILFCGCTTTSFNISDLKPGDIIFQDVDCGPFCDAVDKVTSGYNGKDFSHCALVVQENDSLFIIEAVGQGVVKTSFHQFFGKKIAAGGTLVGRVKKQYAYLAPKAAKNAFQYLGKEYDDVFDINNDKYYCSELVYETYREANNGKDVFKLFPMTYKDPDTQDYFPIWVDYFKKLNVQIPEGEPGLNPGGVSKSDYLDIISISF
ncbi:YiiX/YebB-like N1pC/P60 family cysteine hydrolase [Flammeovirga kamogawensis]|uniref:YiiX family permuted papain-like enzyme n=1 Tax=Flammeovirga kamogawensis TaxID=373891 RepID=A0ABX8H1K7_9BACT|nr:YiiX/YebB-like N1pC/P60 family cysteine hydrolase [Flammeovirga kamogawensis]MBB6463941.1 hypothetical protein [Flammeovirga kamogawensis]QWG09781.1 hypothetical protein KM029_19060 [Flammeovirga kamogawensis]TRX65291.1 hypothetical protein EO216_22470 [Flammeovirga kamogawensis]